MKSVDLIRAGSMLGCVFLSAVVYFAIAAPADEQQILDLEKTLVKAWLKHDTAAVGSILADEFQEWSFRGVRRTKADVLRSVEKNRETDTIVEDPVVRIYGDTAIYTARVTDTGTRENGEKYTETTCVMDVYLRRDRRWRMFASQETRIAE